MTTTAPVWEWNYEDHSDYIEVSDSFDAKDGDIFVGDMELARAHVHEMELMVESLDISGVEKLVERLPNLRVLYLYITEAYEHGVIRALGAFQRLEELKIEKYASRTDALLQEVSGLPNIRKVSIGDFELEESSLEVLQTWSQVESLDLSFLEMRGSSLYALAKMSSLREFSFGMSEGFDRAALSSLCDMRSLERLSLSDHTLEEPLTKDLSEQIPWESFRSLRALSFDCCDFSSKGLRALQTIRQLEELRFSYCSFPSDVLEILGEIFTLRHLEITENDVENPNWNLLVGLEELESFEFFGDPSKSLQSLLLGLPSLQKVSLHLGKKMRREDLEILRKQFGDGLDVEVISLQEREWLGWVAGIVFFALALGIIQVLQRVFPHLGETISSLIGFLGSAVVTAYLYWKSDAWLEKLSS